ncbi:MAG: STAS domain-containing protein [Algibacter sp.]
MSLTIKENKGIFLVEGVINTTTIEQFKNHVEFLMVYTKSITLNIDKVTAIDRKGVKLLGELFQTAQFHKKEFSVVGYGCKEIYEALEQPFPIEEIIEPLRK